MGNVNDQVVCELCESDVTRDLFCGGSGRGVYLCFRSRHVKILLLQLKHGFFMPS